MKYIIASKTKSTTAGFSLIGHRTNRDKILLNEKEVIDSEHLSGTLEKRAEQINGVIYTETEVINLIKQEDWK